MNIVKEKTIKQILTTEPKEQVINVYGWVRTKRESKTFCFLELNDGSTMKNLQIIADNTIDGYEEVMKKTSTGASLKVTGKLMASPGKGQSVEVHALEVTVYGEAPSDYPLQKKRHTLEFLRDIAHIRARTNTLGAVARVRHAMSFAIHKYFQENGFYYVHTPIVTASDCEGAGEMFQVTTLDMNNPPRDKKGNIDYSKDFFGKQASLTVSGQLEGETYACAMGRVYTFGPTFRAENSNTSRHLSEFWMIEPEMAFTDIIGNMDTAEEFLKYIFTYVLDNCQDDMDFFNKFVDKTIINNLNHIIKEKFERVTYTEAMKELEKNNDSFEFPVKWGVDLQSEHEKYLTEKVYKRPVIVTDYPKEIKAFYMKLNEDGKTVRAMDVLVPRLGEIIGGSEREADYDVLLNKIKNMGLEEEDYWWYLDLRKYGSVPHAGFGLGFERVIQFVTGMQNIRDVIPYPRYPKNVAF